LAHEWSHVERRDIVSWHLATLTQFLFFYQPLFWWLRRQLRL
jgi:beta-lactamase regulating signal transducer with metallopeptidase domain